MLRARILEVGHSRFPLARGSLDDFVGIALARDLMRDLLETGTIDLERSLRQPLVVHESVSALRVMEQLRQSPLQVAMVVDEYGSIEGMATPTDILEAIAGDFVDENEEEVAAERQEDGSWLVDGWIDIRRASTLIQADLADAADRYSTLAGYILWQLGNLPSEGQSVAAGDYLLEVVRMDGRVIDKIRIRQKQATA